MTRVNPLRHRSSEVTTWRLVKCIGKRGVADAQGVGERGVVVRTEGLGGDGKQGQYGVDVRHR